MSNALAVTDATFEQEIEKADSLVVVDFWAAWCGPCRMIGPALDELAKEYEGKVKVVKVDVDSNQKSAIRFNVRSIPLVLFFKSGKVVDTVLGAHPKKDYDAKFKQHLAASPAPAATTAPAPSATPTPIITPAPAATKAPIITPPPSKTTA